MTEQLRPLCGVSTCLHRPDDIIRRAWEAAGMPLPLETKEEAA